MPKELLVPEAAATAPEAPIDSLLVWKACAFAGVALMVAGWTDVGLVWLPLQFGNSEWEFASASSTLDGLPLGTIGVVLLWLAGIALEWKRRRQAIGVFSVLVLVLLLLCLLFYSLNLPMAWRAVGAAVRPALKKSIVKTAMLVLAYSALYSGIAWETLKSIRLKRAEAV